MRDEIKPAFKSLTHALDNAIRQSMVRRIEAMERELAYLVEKEDKDLLFIRTKKWNDERVLVLFLLNSFYQQFVGPLEASVRAGAMGLVRTIPVTHGNYRFDAAHVRMVNKASEDFAKLVSSMKYEQDWVTKNTTGDLIYWIARHERETAIT